MPQAGDYQWRKSGKLNTKQGLSNEYNITVNSITWCEEALGKMAENAMYVNIVFGALIAACGIVGLAYYNMYLSSIRSLLEKIEALPPQTTFEVEQKFTWHAGKRSWKPVNTFRIVLV